MQKKIASVVALLGLIIIVYYVYDQSNKTGMQTAQHRSDQKPSLNNPGEESASPDKPSNIKVNPADNASSVPETGDDYKRNEPDPILKNQLSEYDLVELNVMDNTFIIDLKYATTDNFMKKKIYPVSRCLINRNTAIKLIKANNEFKKKGYRIKIFDAYRPYSAQKLLWDAASDKSYVANPKKGSIHNRGAAVDITLADRHGRELEMPSAYDEFTRRAHIDYTDCPKKQIENRELLGSTMIKYGFKRIRTEWWHFEDTNALKYPILDVPLDS